MSVVMVFAAATVAYGQSGSGSETHHVVVVHPPVSIPRTSPVEPRRVRPADWDTVMRVSPAVMRSLGGTPQLIRANGRLVVVSDDRNHLAAFSLRGQLKWTLTANAIGVIRDIEIRGDTVWILDRSSPRVIIAVDGKTVRVRELHGTATLTSVVPFSGAELIACQFAESPPCVRVDSDDVARKSVAFRWREFNRLNPLARSSTLAVDQASDRWVYALSQGDGWFAYDGERPESYIGEYVEHAAFPDVISDSAGGSITVELARHQIFTLAAALAGGVVTVLYKTDTGARFLDQYDFATGRYLASFAANRDARGVAVDGRTYFLLLSSPDRIVGLRARSR